MTIYKNLFRVIMRKYVDGKGYASLDGGITWEPSGTPEALVKSLPYYKIVEEK